MLNIYSFTPTKYFGSNSYLIESCGEFAVVDPSVDYEEVLDHHPNIKGNVKYILLTHAHFDHILKIDSWAMSGAKVCIGRADSKALSDPYLNCYLGFLGTEDGYSGDYIPLDDGNSISLGESKITVISTPGHTPGGVCYKCESNIFVGDTVFKDGGYGRCDLPGGNIDVLEASLIKLFSLSEDAVLYPGHGDPTSLSESIKYFIQ